MTLAIHWIALILLCSVCGCHGWRMQSSIHPLQMGKSRPTHPSVHIPATVNPSIFALLHSVVQNRQHRHGRPGVVVMSGEVNSAPGLAQTEDREKVVIKKLDLSTFTSLINATGKLAVVKFYAPWCRACKSVASEYKKAAGSYSESADFFEVDISKNRDLCKNEQVMLFPSVHFYVPGLGCVERFTINPRTRGKLGRKLDAILSSSSLQELRVLDPAVLKPLVRFKELLGAVEAIRQAPKYLNQKSTTNLLSEQQRVEFKKLFHQLDRNGDGVLDAEEIEAACTMLLSTGCKLDACSYTKDELFSAMMVANDDNMVDEHAFLRLMAQRTKEEIMDRDALYDVFKSIDKDGNGVLQVSELVEAVTNMSSALGQNEMDLGLASQEKIEQLFRAFDIDESGLVDYEEFVNMVVGRTEESGTWKSPQYS